MRSDPWLSRKAAASKSWGVVEAKVNEPVSSVDPQGHDGGLLGRQGEPPLLDSPGQDGGGGARHLHHFQAAVDVVGGVGMVVVDVDFHFAGKRRFGELADAGGLPRCPPG